MPAIPFHATRRGAAFFDAHVPNIMHALENIAIEMNRTNDIDETGKTGMAAFSASLKELTATLKELNKFVADSGNGHGHPTDSKLKTAAQAVIDKIGNLQEIDAFDQEILDILKEALS